MAENLYFELQRAERWEDRMGLAQWIPSRLCDLPRSVDKLLEALGFYRQFPSAGGEC